MRKSKIEAAQWAAELLKTQFLILDTETTGLDRTSEICSISVIDQTGAVLLDTLVKPINTIPQAATDVHGITANMLVDAPGWEQVARRLLPIISGRKVIIYNAVYDRKLMHQSAEACGIQKIDWKTLATFDCAMEMYSQFYGDWNDYHGSYRWQRLTAACFQLGIDENMITAPAHSALGDCLRTLAVIKGMARWYEDTEHA
ncbi:MAG: 3'-5' exonuclease [bacterium]|nr:3'-5' exonuclease [bacterium]